VSQLDNNMQARLEIRNASKARVRAIGFGDPVTNICAGDKNPMLYCYFVEYVVRSRKNGYGITHRDYLAKCTDRKGKFWLIDIDMIYPGHLGEESRKELFEPVWQANHGGK